MIALKTIVTILILLPATLAWPRDMKTVTDKEVRDAYIYLMGRVLVLRQEQLDLTKNDMKWNQIYHREVGAVKWANPNLDVAYSEAWLAIDDKTCTIVEVPEIKNRYYTVQVLNGWGETTANINDREYPKTPHGKFAFCLKETKNSLPAGVVRVNLPNKKSRVLSRIEIAGNIQEATALQQQIKLYSTGTPEISESPKVPEFENAKLPGIEIFTNAQQILDSEKDINPNMGGVQRKVLAVQTAANNKITKEATEKSINTKAIPAFENLRDIVLIKKNGWGYPRRAGNYGSDYEARTYINLAGIWANNSKEAFYVGCLTDNKGEMLDGASVYTLTFTKNKFPDNFVRYFWSVTAVDGKDYRVIQNDQNKFIINNRTDLKANPDGGTTIYFSHKQPANVPVQNWMPTPASGPFVLTFRFYGGNKDVINHKYQLPGLIKSSSLAQVNSGTESTY